MKNDSCSYIETHISMIRLLLRSGLREDIIVKRLLNTDFKIEDIYLAIKAAKILISDEEKWQRSLR